MDERVARLKTPDECEQFALNVQARLPDLARAARRRAVELRAAAHGATSAAEREALEAVYAYERVLSQKRGKKIRASRGKGEKGDTHNRAPSRGRHRGPRFFP